MCQDCVLLFLPRVAMSLLRFMSQLVGWSPEYLLYQFSTMLELDPGYSLATFSDWRMFTDPVYVSPTGVLYDDNPRFFMPSSCRANAFTATSSNATCMLSYDGFDTLFGIPGTVMSASMARNPEVHAVDHTLRLGRPHTLASFSTCFVAWCCSTYLDCRSWALAFKAS